MNSTNNNSVLYARLVLPSGDSKCICHLVTCIHNWKSN